MRKPSPALALVIILLGLFLSISSWRDLFGVRPLALSVFYPFQYTANALVGGVLAVPAAVRNLTRLAADNSALTEEVKQLKLRQLAFDRLEEENQRLRRALGFQNRSPYGYRLVAAQIIGRGPAPWFSIVEIDRGAGSGVSQGQAVVSPAGLVGRVIEVGSLAAKVALLTDPVSSVAAVCYESSDLGVVIGRSTDKLSMKYVGVGGAVKAGDRVMTSQVSTVFPPGILIGRVSQAARREHDLFYQIEIVPAVDFAKLSEVFVVIR